MKRIILPSANQHPTFIGAWRLSPLTICDQIVDYFDTNSNQQIAGVSASGKLDLSIKNRKDITLHPNTLSKINSKVFIHYFESLALCLKDYGVQWPFAQKIFESFDIGAFNIGKYEKGQHFGQVHTERSFINMEREFAFMTYLTDKVEGGCTYFTHYDLNIKPQKGLTLIWPAMWTHAHRGNTVTQGEKYIITGWLDLKG